MDNYELIDKHGNILCFGKIEEDNFSGTLNGMNGLIAIKRKWYNAIHFLVAESFNKSLEDFGKQYLTNQGFIQPVTSNDIVQVTEGNNVYFKAKVSFNYDLETWTYEG